MTSSGTYAFDPGFSDVVLSAYARIQLRRPALTVEHLQDAATEGNMLLSQWSSLQPLLWKSELVSLPLIEGTATYTLNKNIVMLLSVTVMVSTAILETVSVAGPTGTRAFPLTVL